MSYETGDILKFNSENELSYWKVTKTDKYSFRAYCIKCVRCKYKMSFDEEFVFSMDRRYFYKPSQDEVKSELL